MKIAGSCTGNDRDSVQMQGLEAHTLARAAFWARRW